MYCNGSSIVLVSLYLLMIKLNSRVLTMFSCEIRMLCYRHVTKVILLACVIILLNNIHLL